MLRCMASSAHHFTVDEVCDLVAGAGEDREYLFPGSDDDFDVGELEQEYDPWIGNKASKL